MSRRATIVAAMVVALVVAASAAAPLWSSHVAGTGPSTTHASPDDRVVVDGQRHSVLSADGSPVGPTLGSRFFLGADGQGRDVMVRLLYGARNSLLIGAAATLLTLLLAVPLALLAGYLRGPVDGALRALLEVVWAFPVILLGIALGVALALGGLEVGPLEIASGSLLIPIAVIGLVYVPYAARPLRAQVAALREREFVDAARVSGAGSLRIMASELLPNLYSTLLTLAPLLLANAILLEAALSFLGAGVQPPSPSWGTMLADGVERVTTAPHAAIVPGAALVASVLAVNFLGEAFRDHLDARASLRPAR
ncbi:MAG TPA: ABC transporter permease [Thermoleophilaceae bacterium]|nr:ABC transporter permease [Thermoleophilaceae bacterium]